MNISRPILIRKILVGVAIILVFTVGIFIGRISNATTNAFLPRNSTVNLNNADLNQFWGVWSLLNEKYPYKDKIPTDKDRIYGAISGMVASFGDPYTMFFPPKEAKLFEEDVKGEFGGVGMEVGLKQGILTVIAPLKDSPAEKAGIQPGDVVVKINNTTTEGISTDGAVSLIRGPVNSPVVLTIAREGLVDFKEITIIREKISVPVIDTEKRGDVFIINLYSFSENSGNFFEKALDEFRASKSKKLIIDLRNNPGGYLGSAVDIGSLFIPQGKIIIRENQGNAEPELVYRSHGSEKTIPRGTQVIVLVNGGSASASEILAGALSEHGVAKIVGTQTFGKGSVQELITLPDGSSVKITVAKWYTPNGVSISEKGITPNVIVEDKPTEKNPDPTLTKAMNLF